MRASMGASHLAGRRRERRSRWNQSIGLGAITKVSIPISAPTLNASSTQHRAGEVRPGSDGCNA